MSLLNFIIMNMNNKKENNYDDFIIPSWKASPCTWHSNPQKTSSLGSLGRHRQGEFWVSFLWCVPLSSRKRHVSANPQLYPETQKQHVTAITFILLCDICCRSITFFCLAHLNNLPHFDVLISEEGHFNSAPAKQKKTEQQIITRTSQNTPSTSYQPTCAVWPGEFAP